MKVVWAGEEPPDSFRSAVFLAGPTPRNADVPSWRPECLELLEQHGYDGVVFVPEPPGGDRFGDYDSQVEWEAMGLQMADVILFWVPRDLETMPAFTTNVEWGMWYDSGKAVWGAPSAAPKNTYLTYYAKKSGAPVCSSLTETVSTTLKLIGEGAERHGSERDVPLIIWRRNEFQNWYAGQKRAGHRLDGAELIWHFRGRPNLPLFCWILRVNVHLPDEGRNKAGEFFLTRMDASAVLAWRPAAELLDSEIVLIREFRSAAALGDAYVWELPGGSACEDERGGECNQSSPRQQAAEELSEETGITIDVARFQHIASRQSAATLLTHQIHLFAVELAEAEVQSFRDQAGIVHGENASERCTVHVLTLREVLAHKSIDWSQLGMILSHIVPARTG